MNRIPRMSRELSKETPVETSAMKSIERLRRNMRETLTVNRSLAIRIRSGWDIRSVDQQNKVRLIEVKGKGCLWDGDEVVELSHAQVRESFKAEDGQVEASWYLYVVEKTPENTFRVLPIRSPAQTATGWMLSGRAWRMVAEGALERSAASSNQNP